MVLRHGKLKVRQLASSREKEAYHDGARFTFAIRSMAQLPAASKVLGHSDEEATQQITLREALGMTSGLPNLDPILFSGSVHALPGSEK